jgi:hypothetical protein
MKGAAMKTVRTYEASIVHEPQADDLWTSQLLYAEAEALLEAGQRDLALIKLDHALAHNPYHVLALTAREKLCGSPPQVG